MKMPIARRSGLEARIRELEEARSEVARLQSELRSTIDARDTAERAHSAILGDRDRLVAVNARTRAEAAAQIDTMCRAVATLEATLEQANRRLDASEQRLDAAYRDVKELAGREAALRETNAIARCENEALKDKLSYTESALAETSAREKQREAEIVLAAQRHISLESQVAAEVQKNQALSASAAQQLEVERALPEAIATLRKSGARSRLLKALAFDELTQKPDRKGVFTQHKTASMFVWRLMGFLADLTGVEVSGPNGSDAEYVLDEINIAGKEEMISELSGIIGPFRGYVDFDFETFGRLIVITRDPRDLLVSMYYSWAYSHPIGDKPTLVASDGTLFNPSAELRMQWIDEGPDPFVLEYAGFVEGNLKLLLDRIASRENATHLRYEDLIVDWRSWVRQFLLGLGCRKSDVAELMPFLEQRFAGEFVVPEEDPKSHRRQMLPGDHKRKLKAATIRKLTDRFDFYFATQS